MVKSMRNKEILFIIKIRNEARRTLQGMTGDLRKMGKQAQAAAASLKRVQTQQRKSVKTTRSLGASFNSLIGSWQRIIALGGPLAGAFAIGGIISKTVKSTIDFEDSLQRIVGLVGIAQTEVDAFGKEILELAGETGRAPTELAEGLFFVTSASFEGAEAVDVLTKSAQAARIGLGQTRVVAKALTASLTAYQKTGLTAADATDILVATVREGNLEASEFAGSIGQILPFAVEAGVSLDELGATVAALTRTGASASETISGLRGVLVALTKENEKGARVLEAVGTSFADIRKEIREEGLLVALTNLRERVGDSETAFTDIFGRVEAAAVALGLTGANADTVAVVFDELANSSGSLASAIDAVEKSVGDRFRKALQSASASLIEIGSVVLPIVADALGLISDNIAGLSAVLVFLAGRVILPKVLPALTLLTGLFTASGRAALGAAIRTRKFQLALKAIGIGLLIQAIVDAVDLFKQFKTDLTENVKVVDLVAEAFRVFGSRLGIELKEIGNRLVLFGKIFSNALTFDFEEAEANFDALIASFKDTLTGAGFEGVFEEAVRNVFNREQAIRAAKRMADGLAAGLQDRIRQSQNLKEAGRETGNQLVSGFNEALEAANLDFKQFETQLGAIVKEFRPAIAAAQAQSKALEVLSIAALATDAQLAEFGLTQKSLAALTNDVKNQTLDLVDVFGEELLAIDQRIALIGISNRQKEIESQLQEAVNKGIEENKELTLEQIAALRARLVVEQDLLDVEKRSGERAKAEKKFNESIITATQSLAMQRAQIGLTSTEIEKQNLLVALRNEAEAAGLRNIDARVDAVAREFDKLQEAQAAFDQNPFEGVKLGLQDVITEGRNLNAQFRDFTVGSINTAKDAFNDFITTGKFNFADFTASILADLQRIATNKIFAELAAGAFGGTTGGAGGAGGGALLAGLFNKGGIVGQSPVKHALVAASAFKNAAKFQKGGPISGGGKDTVPILATPGEVILNEGQAKTLRSALAGRGVGSVSGGTTTSAGGSATTNRQVNANVTMVIQGVTDVAGFNRNKNSIARETAAGLNRALIRDN